MRLTYKRWHRAHRVFDEVVDHYGKSFYHLLRPKLILLSNTRFHKMNFGTWDDPNPSIGRAEVCINFARCSTWEEVVGTIVHEVWHHHQAPERKDEKAYEAEAELVAIRDTPRFMKVR